MQDVVTPHYERLSGHGQIINNPMVKTKVETYDAKCSYTKHYEWKLWTCDPEKWITFTNKIWGVNEPSSKYLDVANDLPSLPEFSTTALIDLAVSKAWAAIGDESLLSLVAVGESQKTVVSMISIMTRLIKIIKMIKKADYAGLRKQVSAKELSDRYMEIRYAIRPLMYDTKGIVDALTKTAISKPTRYTFRGSSTYQDGDTDYESVPWSTQTAKGTFHYTKEYRKQWAREIFVRAGVLTELEETSQLNIWGLTRPIESAWELVPFSFIIDWFFNISDVLGSWSPNYGFNTLASWYTMHHVEYQHLSMHYSESGCESRAEPTDYEALAFTNDMRNCCYEKTTTTVVRVPNPSRGGVPHLNLRLDAFKLTDLLIIARKLWLGGNVRGGGLRY
jgi:hypothetical protein